MCFGGGGSSQPSYYPPTEQVASASEIARLQRLHAALGSDQQKNTQVLDQDAQDATKISEPTRVTVAKSTA